MAKGFKYREIENIDFLEFNQIGRIYQTTTQLTLFDDGDDTAHSNVKYLGLSEHQDFHKFYVSHETEKRMRVRFQKVERNSVIAIEEFPI